ncbi:MAG: hypothetical protein DWQ01_04675 [Planctomycetota bacterium]|nr:MAG: hypothetical protein DWQ01_04675 [Planctomycetota bacterium]
MSKEKSTWHSPRLNQEVTVVRWGVMGKPVLLFPTAGGDAEECERFLMLDALADLLGSLRIKIYSVDSIAGRAWLAKENSTQEAASVQNAFDSFIYEEVVPAIRTDCQDEEVEVITAGSSIGAFNALAALTRHPDVFSHAICMSGSYDMSKFLEGPVTPDYHRASPLHFLSDMNNGDPRLAQLRERFVLISHGEGRWEDPQQSWLAANALGNLGVPNRVDVWGEEWDHDWPTWRQMLPQFLDELAPQ